MKIFYDITMLHCDITMFHCALTILHMTPFKKS